MGFETARTVMSRRGSDSEVISTLPSRVGRTRAAAGGGPERTVCDYVAGMTDRYAQDEFLRLFQPYTNV